MENVLQIVVALAFVRFSCRATFFRSVWGLLGFAVAVAVCTFASYTFVIEQSGDFYSSLLKERDLVETIALGITVEAIVGMLLSIGMLQTLFGAEKKWMPILRLLPEVLIVGAIFYAEQQAFYAFPGYDFMLVGLFSALLFAIVVGGLGYCIHRLLPEQGGRYELNFLLNLFLLLAGVLLNAGLSSYNQGQYKSKVEWSSAFVFLLLILCLFALGFLLLQLKWKNKKLNKILKWIL